MDTRNRYLEKGVVVKSNGSFLIKTKGWKRCIFSIFKYLLIAGMLTNIISCEPYAYKTISALPFIGGSLLMDLSNPKINQLPKGAKIPIRLGKLKKINVSTDKAPENVRTKAGAEAQLEYSNVEDGATYGYIEVLSSNVKAIILKTRLFDEKGKKISEKIDTIRSFLTGDLNRDGNPDVEYTDSISSRRCHTPGRMYLKFISSRTNLYTSMFSYITEIFKNLPNAGGNMGFNSNGNEIIKTSPAKTKSLEKGLPLEPGDVLIDSDRWKYVRVASGSITKAMIDNGNYPTAELIRGGAAIKSFSDVYPLLSMNMCSKKKTSPYSARKLETRSPFRVFDDSIQYKGRVDYYKRILKGYGWHGQVPSILLPIDKLQLSKNGVTLGFLNANASVGIDGSLSVTFQHISSSLFAMALFDGLIGVTCEQDAWLREQYELSPSNWSTTFVIGYVIFDIGISTTVGFDAGLTLSQGTSLGVHACGVVEGSFGIDASWTSFSTSSDCYKDFFICPVYNLKSSSEQSCYVFPYVVLSPGVHIEELVSFNFPVKLSLGPYWTLRRSTTKVTVNTGIQLQCTSQFVASATVGFDDWWCPGCYISYPLDTKQLFQFTDTLWHKEYDIVLLPHSNVYPTEILYPAPDCPPGMELNDDRVCRSPCPQGYMRDENGNCYDPFKKGSSITFYVKFLPQSSAVREIKWKGELLSALGPDYPGRTLFDSTVIYNLCQDTGCSLRGTSVTSPCCEIAESFYNLQPGTWKLEIWSGYDLIGTAQVNLANNTCLFVKFPGNNPYRGIPMSYTPFEHNPGVLPSTEFTKRCTKCP